MTKKMTLEQNVVIVGASHAGIALAEHLRKHGFDGKITMIDRQDAMPIERPPLSKAVLSNPAEKTADFRMRPPEWYEMQKITLKKATEAVAASAQKKTLTLAGGEVLAWDRLVLATGAVPRRMALWDKPDLARHVHVLRVPSEAERLSIAMTTAKNTAKSPTSSPTSSPTLSTASGTAKSMAIIGGGYIGLEVAASARKRGLEVTVIEAAPRILARVASSQVSQYFHQLHTAQGVKIETGAMALQSETHRAETSRAEDSVTIDIKKTSGGEEQTIQVDLVLLGIGVLPDMALAESLGLETGDGILVDGDYRTNIADVWAIGDVALPKTGYTGGAMRIESVHHAQMSAEIAADAIMGLPPKSHEVPWFWSEQYDRKLQSAGLVSPNSFAVKRLGKRAESVSFWSFEGQNLVAVEAINDPQAYMIGKTVLASRIAPRIAPRIAITPEQIADPDFVLKTLIRP